MRLYKSWPCAYQPLYPLPLFVNTFIRLCCALFNLGLSMAPCVVCARAVSGWMYALECDACNGWCHNNNNINNNHDNVYGAVIMAEPLREFTRFIWWTERYRCQKGTRFILLYYFVRCRLRIRPMSWQRIMWIMSTSVNIYRTALCLATKIVNPRNYRATK